jgi:hypothetical protein
MNWKWDHRNEAFGIVSVAKQWQCWKLRSCHQHLIIASCIRQYPNCHGMTNFWNSKCMASFCDRECISSPAQVARDDSCKVKSFARWRIRVTREMFSSSDPLIALFSLGNENSSKNTSLKWNSSVEKKRARQCINHVSREIAVRDHRYQVFSVCKIFLKVGQRGSIRSIV